MSIFTKKASAVAANKKRVTFAEEPQTSVTTVSYDEELRSSAVVEERATAAKKAKKSSGVSKRPRDVFIEDAAQTSDLLRKPTEPATAVLQPVRGAEDASESVSANNVFSIDTYQMTQRYMVQAMLRSADFQQSGSDRDAQNVKAALVHAQQRQLGVNPAAYTNYMIRLVDTDRARTSTADGIALLDSTPYSDSTVSAFASNFIATAIECAPDVNAHEHVPSNEMRAASKSVLLDYMMTFMRTAHPGDFACASRDECVGMELYDDHNNKLPPTVWKVFWFADEFPEVTADPAKFAAEAKYRYCIGCKIDKANKCLINATSRNNRVLPDVLATDFHVFVDIVGEFPIVATRGRCSDGHYGLVQNIPAFSRVGWSAAPDGQRANCYIYRWNIPRFPIPRSWYERDVVGGGRGF